MSCISLSTINFVGFTKLLEKPGMGDTIILAVLPIKQRNDISEYGVTFILEITSILWFTLLCETGSISIDVSAASKKFVYCYIELGLFL